MGAADAARGLDWIGIVRLGLVQTALGSIVVLTTSTLNRVMVVELMLPAMVPGALVGWHYAVQMLRPRWGYGSDMGGRRTPWIIGGMGVLALGGMLAAFATMVMAGSTLAGFALAAVAFLLIGVGVGASGTSLLALLATRVAPGRRAAAASIVWMMMIVGFVVTAITAGNFLDPFSLMRLMAVTSAVGAIAFVVSVLAVWGIEGRTASAAPDAAPHAQAPPEKPAFRDALREIWGEDKARRFTIFVFVSMLAYSAQDLILEPFAGLVFGLTPGESTKLAGVQHSGVLLGMIIVAIAGSAVPKRFRVSLKVWTIGGCIASALALGALMAGGLAGPGWPLKPSVFALGLANGIFAVAAIGSMMMLAGEGRKSREGMRMGLWGASQAIAFGLGGFLGTVAVDAMRIVTDSPVIAYGTVFMGEATLFLIAAALAARVQAAGDSQSTNVMNVAGDGFAAGAGGG